MMRGIARSTAGLIVPLVFIALWELAGQLQRLPEYLPPPSAIGQALLEVVRSGEIFHQAGASLLRVTAGFMAGAAAGVLLGLVAGTVHQVRDLVEPLFIALNPIPKIAFLPIFVIAFGLGHGSKIVIIALAVFFPVFIASLEGLATVPKHLTWVARSMGTGPVRLLMRVALPASLPQIFAGLRIGLALSFIVLFAAELMGGNSGLGYLITTAENGVRFDLMLAAIVVVALFGFVADRALLRVRARVLRGRLANRAESA
jgi:ABC-type nitrate/sulfonate/bicarbonate transport system permease component